MTTKFHIECRFAPLTREDAVESGPLLVRLDSSILSFHIQFPRPCPKGLNIDHTMLFDMQADGGVDGVEIFVSPDYGFKPNFVYDDLEESYWRLFLALGDFSAIEESGVVQWERAGNSAILRIDSGDVDARYLIGPGAMALVGANCLQGFEVDLLPFLE